MKKTQKPIKKSKPSVKTPTVVICTTCREVLLKCAGGKYRHKSTPIDKHHPIASPPFKTPPEGIQYEQPRMSALEEKVRKEWRAKAKKAVETLVDPDHDDSPVKIVMPDKGNTTWTEQVFDALGKKQERSGHKKIEFRIDVNPAAYSVAREVVINKLQDHVQKLEVELQQSEDLITLLESLPE